MSMSLIVTNETEIMQSEPKGLSLRRQICCVLMQGLTDRWFIYSTAYFSQVSKISSSKAPL